MVRRITLLAALLASTVAYGQDIPSHSVPVSGGPGVVGWKSVGPCPAGQVIGWNSPTSDPVCLTGGGAGAGVSSVNGITGPITFVAGTNMTIVPGSPNAQSITLNSAGGGGGDPCLALNLTGDVHSVNSCLTTLATVNANLGSFGTASSVATFTVNAKGLITAAGTVPINLPFTSLSGTMGCAQMPVLTGDVTSAGGTCNTVIPNNAITDAKLAQTGAATIKGNPTSVLANVSAFTIQGLPNKAIPDVNNDKLLLFDAAAGGFKYCTVGQCSVSGTAGVSSLNTLTGALNLSGAGGITITPSGSNIQIGFTAATNPTTTVLSTGSGTYTLPTGVVRIEVYLVGGGAGGQAGGTAPGVGTAGGTTSFGILSASGGRGGGDGTNPGGGGVGSGCTVNTFGGAGDGGSLSFNSPAFNGKGGAGGASYWGGGGQGAYGQVGHDAQVRGAGGAGGSASNAAIGLGGTGGGAGGFCYSNIRTPATGVAWAVGAGGAGGALGSNGWAGGTGAEGLILIKEYYSTGGGGGGGPGGGVTTLNTLVGDLSIAAGSGISISQAGSTITITNSSAAGAIFTTGDIKPTMKTVADTGWVMMNDGTIGNAASGGTTRANADTQALFVLLWTNCNQGNCPVIGGRGSTALNDFNANKVIQLPLSMSRGVGVAGAGQGLTARGLGGFFGTETSLGVPGTVSVTGTHTLTLAEMPSHNHNITNQGDPPWKFLSTDTTGTSGVLNSDVFLGTTYGASNAFAPTSSFVGGGAAFTMPSTGTSSTDVQMFEPKVYWNFMIKL